MPEREPDPDRPIPDLIDQYREGFMLSTARVTNLLQIIEDHKVLEEDQRRRIHDLKQTVTGLVKALMDLDSACDRLPLEYRNLAQIKEARAQVEQVVYASVK